MLNFIKNLLKNKSEDSVILQHHFESHHNYQIENNITPLNEQHLS